MMFYFVWMSFHARPYGDLHPTRPSEEFVVTLVLFCSTLAWALPVLLVARRYVFDSQIFPPERSWSMPATLKAIVAPYAVCFSLLVALAGIGASSCTEEREYSMCQYDRALFVLISTFHGACWGHIIPRTAEQAFTSCVAASLGYLWRPVMVLLILRIAAQSGFARFGAKLFLWSYVSFAFIGNLVFAGVSVSLGGQSDDWTFCNKVKHTAKTWKEEASGCDFGVAFYYVWMVFHARAYGEISPVSDADHVVGAFIVLAGAFCWIVPLLLFARKAVLDVVLSKITTVENPQPEVIGIVYEEQVQPGRF